jgi:hypothetical protein
MNNNTEPTEHETVELLSFSLPLTELVAVYDPTQRPLSGTVALQDVSELLAWEPSDV